jgi:hypothetical protein
VFLFSSCYMLQWLYTYVHTNYLYMFKFRVGSRPGEKAGIPPVDGGF